jgi:glycosyltransferase involved in cell wall biosynthesis
VIRVWHGIGALRGGGAEKQLCLLLNELPADNFVLRVATVRDTDPSPPLPLEVETICLKRTRIWRWDEVWRSVKHDLEDFRPDVIHAWLPEVISLPAAFWGWRMGIPVISSVRRSFFKGIGVRAWVRECLGLLPHLFATEIVSNFPLDHEPMGVRWLLNRKPRIVIRNGVDTRRVAENLDLHEGPPLRMVFVGRFARQKRLERLLKALAQVRADGGEVHLEVFGSGTADAERRVLECVRELGLGDGVDFRGYDPGWRRYADRFHLLAFPSACEGMPNVVVEAMAEGLPVLGSDIPELDGIVEEGVSGWRFPCDDEKRLVDILKKFSNMPPDPAEWRDRTRAAAARFSLSRMGMAYNHLYKELYQEKRKS